MKHGGDLTEAIAHYGGTPEMWLDLSTGINPWPWPIPQLPETSWQRLPSRADEAALIDAARAAYGVPNTTGIAIAPGTQALIQWLPRLAASGPVAVASPTYSEHALAWENAGHAVTSLDPMRVLPETVRHAVIVNPNNPDGRIIDRVALAPIASEVRDRGGWLVIDEAFADIDPRMSAVALCRELPVIVLRSFGKFFGLAGLRLGFAIAAPEIAQMIKTALGPWPCSGPALAIGRAALLDNQWAERTRESLQHHAERLDAILAGAGWSIAGGTDLFRLARHPEARSLHGALARQHIWCRSFDWADDLVRFGLPPSDAGLDRLAVVLQSRK
ncbi:MAG: threonine-phosphate decarboxylase [Proteobacteria bacterium]|nr:threonine-phosphate decarboxylase [Pseudomonadota bacterium]